MDGGSVKPTWTSDCGTVQLYLGDCLDVLPTIAPGSVDAVVVDPAYESLNVAVATGTTTRLVRRDAFAGNRLASRDGRSWFSTMDGDSMHAAFSESQRVLANSGAMYVFVDVKTGV